MNLRTLKKLSKRAAALLPLLGDTRDQFPAERGDNYASVLISARKHWERSPCHPTHNPWNDYSTPRGMPIRRVTRAGRHIVIKPPSHPRKGTIMVGGMDGGEQPEWSEETAWEALRMLVWAEFTDWSKDDPVPLREFKTPGDIFRAAAELIAERESERNAKLARLNAQQTARAA